MRERSAREVARQAIENTLRTHVTDAEAHAIAELTPGSTPATSSTFGGHASSSTGGGRASD